MAPIFTLMGEKTPDSWRISHIVYQRSVLCFFLPYILRRVCVCVCVCVFVCVCVWASLRVMTMQGDSRWLQLCYQSVQHRWLNTHQTLQEEEHRMEHLFQ